MKKKATKISCDTLFNHIDTELKRVELTKRPIFIQAHFLNQLQVMNTLIDTLHNYQSSYTQEQEEYNAIAYPIEYLSARKVALEKLFNNVNIYSNADVSDENYKMYQDESSKSNELISNIKSFILDWEAYLQK